MAIVYVCCLIVECYFMVVLVWCLLFGVYRCLFFVVRRVLRVVGCSLFVLVVCCLFV